MDTVGSIRLGGWDPLQRIGGKWDPLQQKIGGHWYPSELYPSQQDYRIKTNEAGDDYIVVPVPGFNKDTISVKRNGKYIEIRGKTEDKTFNKSILLNRNVEDMQGKVRDGVLTLTFKDKEYKQIPIS